MVKLIDTKMLRYSSIEASGIMEIDDEYIYPSERYYNTIEKEEILGMKPLGRIYFDRYNHLDYTDGTPKERAIIDGGERGMIERYMEPGARVYTDNMVLNIIRSKVYENNDELKPKLPVEVYEFLTEIASNKGKNKPARAKELLEKFNVVGTTV
ncbi:hypothetical protein MUA52_05060 [Staphylococcus agnetis]|uniref:hypothetical protein n=1 Tax=Staphylococcus agnetis TaxID=985762 RepID=UPI0021D3C9FE|nr:hypothetical protein [Staphylococcus agnetis]UXU67455.1 hypothetical protein MUA52_05060 [Staphylococcus agnetis]